jgi:hypothetical protein
MSKLYPLHIHTENGKWKYTAKVYIPYNVVLDYKSPDPFRDIMDAALSATPNYISGVVYDALPADWIGVLPKSPLGYPIMSLGRR